MGKYVGQLRLYKKPPQTGWFKQQLLLTVVEAERSKIKIEVIWFLVRALFLACGCLLSHCVFTRLRQLKEEGGVCVAGENTLDSLLRRTLIPLWAPSLMTSPKVPPS